MREHLFVLVGAFITAHLHVEASAISAIRAERIIHIHTRNTPLGKQTASHRRSALFRECCRLSHNLQRLCALETMAYIMTMLYVAYFVLVEG